MGDILDARLALADALAIPDSESIPPLPELVERVVAQLNGQPIALVPTPVDGSTDPREVVSLDIRVELAEALGHVGNVPGWRELLAQANGAVGQQHRVHAALLHLARQHSRALTPEVEAGEVVTDDLVTLVGECLARSERENADAAEQRRADRRALDELRGHLALVVGRSPLAPFADDQMIDDVRTYRTGSEAAVSAAHQLAAAVGVNLARLDGDGWAHIVRQVERLAQLRRDVAGAVHRDPDRLGDVELVDLVRNARQARTDGSTLRRELGELLATDPDAEAIVVAVRDLIEQVDAGREASRTLAGYAGVDPSTLLDGNVVHWGRTLDAVRALATRLGNRVREASQAIGFRRDLAAALGGPSVGDPAPADDLVGQVRKVVAQARSVAEQLDQPRELAMSDEPDVVEVWTQDAQTGQSIHWLRDLDDGRPQGWRREVGGGHMFWPELLAVGPVFLADPGTDWV